MVLLDGGRHEDEWPFDFSRERKNKCKYIVQGGFNVDAQQVRPLEFGRITEISLFLANLFYPICILGRYLNVNSVYVRF